MSLLNKANAAFGTGVNTGAELTLSPRWKFNYDMDLILLGNDKSGQPHEPNKVWTRIKSVQLPEITYKTQTANQYNRPRNIQTGIEYGTCTVAFYDTLDNDFHRLLLAYNKHYYHTGAGLSIDPTNHNLHDHQAEVFHGQHIDTSVGYTALDDHDPVNMHRYYIKQLRISQYGLHNHVRQTLMENCMITNVQMDQLDYGDSQPIFFTVTFQPEMIKSGDFVLTDK
jgi:hypothetical protein